MPDPADRKHDAVIDRRERDVLEHGHRVGANDRLTVWSILFSGSIFYPKPKYVQGWAKEWSLGCVNSRPAARGSQEAGFTQPRDHSFAQHCCV